MKKFTIAAVLLVPTILLAQQIEKPVYKDGQWCDYQNEYNNTIRQTINLKSDGGFTITGEGQGIEREVREYTADHKLVNSRGTVYTPYWPSPNFPIKVGDKGPLNDFTYQTRAGRVTTARGVLDSVTREKVTVPAGTFDALITKLSIPFSRDGRSDTYLVETWWAVDGSIVRPLRTAFTDRRFRQDSWDRRLIRCGDGVSGPAAAHAPVRADSK